MWLEGPYQGPRKGGRRLLVLSSICASLYCQAPAWGQASCTEGFKLQAKHREQSPMGCSLHPTPVHCLFRATHSHPAQGLHLDVALGGVIQKPYPHSSSTWGLKRRHRCSPGSPGDQVACWMPPPFLPQHMKPCTHGSGSYLPAMPLPSIAVEDQAARDIAEPAGAGHRSSTSGGLVWVT